MILLKQLKLSPWIQEQQMFEVRGSSFCVIFGRDDGQTRWLHVFS